MSTGYVCQQVLLTSGFVFMGTYTWAGDHSDHDYVLYLVGETKQRQKHNETYFWRPHKAIYKAIYTGHVLFKKPFDLLHASGRKVSLGLYRRSDTIIWVKNLPGAEFPCRQLCRAEICLNKSISPFCFSRKCNSQCIESGPSINSSAANECFHSIW